MMQTLLGLGQKREKLVCLVLMAAKEIDWSRMLNTDEEMTKADAM
jgi:hypothetical protein